MGDAGSSQPADTRIETIRQGFRGHSHLFGTTRPAEETENCPGCKGEAALNAVAAELAGLRQALVSLRKREVSDGSLCWCPIWWVVVCEEAGDDFTQELSHDHFCKRARAALSRGATP